MCHLNCAMFRSGKICTRTECSTNTVQVECVSSPAQPSSQLSRVCMLVHKRGSRLAVASEHALPGGQGFSTCCLIHVACPACPFWRFCPTIYLVKSSRTVSAPFDANSLLFMVGGESMGHLPCCNFLFPQRGCQNPVNRHSEQVYFMSYLLTVIRLR